MGFYKDFSLDKKIQMAAEKFIACHIYNCAGECLEMILDKIFSGDIEADFYNTDTEDKNGTGEYFDNLENVCQWWTIDPNFRDDFIKAGELVIVADDLTFWGRTGAGYSLSEEAVLRKIGVEMYADDFEI